jgi:hypothetical protein
MAAIAYYILQQAIIWQEGRESVLKRAVGRDLKGKLSPLFYVLGIAASFWSAPVSAAIYVAVAAIWLVPDRRIERQLTEPAA